MVKDVIYNKCAIIERCLGRIREEYAGNPENLQNYTKQDSIILNIQRACEACIDLAMHIAAEKHLGIPQSSREAFELLSSHQYISEELAKNLKAMVGFRNIAVHNYQIINLKILEKVIEDNLIDLQQFSQTILEIL